MAVPAAFLGCLFAWPVVAIVATGLRSRAGGWDVRGALDTLVEPATRSVLRFTLVQALASTVVTLVVALPAAWVLGRIDFRGKAAYRVAVTVPFVLPTVVVSAAMLALVGPRGALVGVARLDDTLTVIVVAHAFFNYAVVARVVGSQWGQLDPRAEEAARALGAGRMRVLATITLPRLRAAIASAAVLTFLFCFTSYGVIVLLGDQDQATLETAIARVTTTSTDRSAAAALALLQLAVVATLLTVEARLRDRRAIAHGQVPERLALHRPRSRGERAAVAGVLVSTALFLGTPIAVLAERSFRVGDGYGLAWYRALGEPGGRASTLFVSPWDAIGTSILYATAAAAIAVVVGGVAAIAVAARQDRLGRTADTLLALPLGASAVTIGLGFLVALDAPPLDLRDSAVLVPLAHALVGVPFVVRAVVPALRGVDPRLRQAAAVLGSPPWRVFRDIDLTLARRSVLAAAGFAFAVSLGEFGATSILARAERPTVTVAIERLLGQPGAASFGQAAAMSVVLLVLTAAAILAVDRGRVGAATTF
ncbi:MAG: iron ABC transporter permease [Acidimicrobiia bacterium]|nr:iron ABC transporter permease [Acidimicrobiia bacterium]